MKNSFLIILICSLLLNCTQTERTKSFTLNGKILGQNSGKIVLQYGLYSSFQKKTAEIYNGTFTFTGIIEEPTRVWIDGGDEFNRTQIYLEPGISSITLTKDKFQDSNFKGSRSQTELNQLNKLLKDSKNRDSVLFSFVSKNPQSYLTPFYLGKLNDNHSITPDLIKAIFENLDQSIQKSIYGRVIKGVIRKNENMRQGCLASEFTAIDFHNKTITLSQFKNNSVVLLDFWNSPCGPCRKGMPHLLSLYNQYHPKGLEVIAVNCWDKDKNAWLSAIKQDSTNVFRHVATAFIDGEIINEDLLFDYPVFGVPKKILINKEGKVVSSWIGYSNEIEAALDKKLAEIIND